MTLKPDSELFEGQTLNWKSLDKLFDGHFYDYYGEWNLIHWPSFKTWKVVLKRIQRHCSDLALRILIWISRKLNPE